MTEHVHACILSDADEDEGVSHDFCRCQCGATSSNSTGESEWSTPQPAPRETPERITMGLALATIKGRILRNGLGHGDHCADEANCTCGTALLQDLLEIIEASASPLPTTTPPSWRCFHCDEVFTNGRDAAEHFGDTERALVACQIKGHEHNLVRVIREQEAQLATYRNEDGQILRALESLRSEQAEALRRAEEDGYGRGVRDMKLIAEKQFGEAVNV